LLPGGMVNADMIADNPGEWLYHCHVADHIEAGMFTTYLIKE
jgi:FtsP/CotA-like multicopper oxidase with cupredoxin domain